MNMRKLKDRKRIYLFTLLSIVILSLYVLIRFVNQSLDNNTGNVERLRNFISYKLADKVFLSGSSLLSYNTNSIVEDYSFPVTMMDKGLAVHDYLNKEEIFPVVVNKSFINVLNNEETANAQNKSSIGFNNIAKGFLASEYVLSNGGANIVDNLEQNNMDVEEVTGQIPIGVIDGEFYFEENEDKTIEGDSAVETINTLNDNKFTMEQLKDVNFLARNFYIVDPTTRITEELFDAEIMLNKDMTIKQENDKPQILIYHTHSQEVFADSRKNVEADTVVGIGSQLAEILRKEYGYNVIHDTSCYDVVNGVMDRSEAYKYARTGVEKILEKNPSIEVIIDLHTDGMPKRSTDINGEETAQIMLFNGLSRDQKGPITRLDNPYLQDNLSFSLQLQMKSRELYPKLFFKNYLKCWRYNLHLRPKAILIEWGTYKNTLQSAENALHPFAKILDSVLQGK